MISYIDSQIFNYFSSHFNQTVVIFFFSNAIIYFYEHVKLCDMT